MYIGRIVSVGMGEFGRVCVSYRVSSRSFPNRTAVKRGTTVSIVPKPGHEADISENPYIAYNCLRVVCDNQIAVITNGGQTDPIAEKIASGMNIRDSIALSLLALDYEKDQYHTPRIVAVADRRDEGSGWLGVVRDSGLEVKRVPLRPGVCFYVATYEENTLDDNYRDAFHVRSVADACDTILYRGIFAERSNPVTAVAALSTLEGFEIAVQDALPGADTPGQ
jgi:IMP cyclohydrolase